MGFLRWIAITFSSDLPDPGVKPVSAALAGAFFATDPPGKPQSTTFWGKSELRWLSLFILSQRSQLELWLCWGEEELRISWSFLGCVTKDSQEIQESKAQTMRGKFWSWKLKARTEGNCGDHSAVVFTQLWERKKRIKLKPIWRLSFYSTPLLDLDFILAI